MGTPADDMKADGSEPGGGAGMENIERLAGPEIGTDPVSAEERRVEQMAAGVGDMPDVGEATRDRNGG